MNSLIKKIKSLLKNFIVRENKQIIKFIEEFDIKLNFLDLGSAGGIQKKWTFVNKFLNAFIVEPIETSLNQSQIKNLNSKTIIKTIFSSKDNNIEKLYITKKNDVSSVLKPNFEHLNKFLNSHRYKICKEEKFSTSSINSYFKDITLDFVKIDTEGYALEILKGAEKKLNFILGFEIEVEFFYLRKKQPLFHEITNFLEQYGFEFIDFINIVRWERNSFRFTGQPQVADVLFLKKPEIIIEKYLQNPFHKDIILKYIMVLIVFNRSDLIYFIINKIDQETVKKYCLQEIYLLIEQKVIRMNKAIYFSDTIKKIINYDI